MIRLVVQLSLGAPDNGPARTCSASAALSGAIHGCARSFRCDFSLLSGRTVNRKTQSKCPKEAGAFVVSLKEIKG
jgi:hypothetical protein